MYCRRDQSDHVVIMIIPLTNNDQLHSENLISWKFSLRNDAMTTLWRNEYVTKRWLISGVNYWSIAHLRWHGSPLQSLVLRCRRSDETASLVCKIRSGLNNINSSNNSNSLAPDKSNLSWSYLQDVKRYNNIVFMILHVTGLRNLCAQWSNLKDYIWIVEYNYYLHIIIKKAGRDWWSCVARVQWPVRAEHGNDSVMCGDAMFVMLGLNNY